MLQSSSHARRWLLVLLLVAVAGWCLAAEDQPRADILAVSPEVVLQLPGSGSDPQAIDYAALPVLRGEHAVVHAPTPELKFQLHNYLIHFEDKFWCMWSHGPVVEDVPSQFISYATSDDGLRWSEPKSLTGSPPEGHAYIARGFWLRDGELLALVAFFKGKGAFGVDKQLKLQAYSWNSQQGVWKLKGIVADNAINNFAPQRLSSGPWMTTKRDSRFNVSMLIGGVTSFDDWQAFPVVERGRIKGFSPDEPIWWEVPAKTAANPAGSRLVALFRDNGGSSRLFRAFSTDQGRTWSLPALTNYPNSTSKIYSLVTSQGDRLLIGNANPKLGRRELHLALSTDGLTFTRLARLDIPSPKPATLQYPHAIEHNGQLLITYSRGKNQSEVFRVSLADIAAWKKSELNQTP
jgi:hypothetical protein